MAITTRSGSAVADGGSDSVSGLVARLGTSVSYIIANIGSSNRTLGSLTFGLLTNGTESVTTAPASIVTAGNSKSPCGVGIAVLGLMLTLILGVREQCGHRTPPSRTEGQSRDPEI